MIYWAICRLMEIHDTREDYALVVERHDDVVVLDCPVDPMRVDFYQIKSKDDGDWKLAKLLYAEKSKADPAKKGVEKKMSHMAKLYSNRIACDGFEITASFVSNARFALTLANGENGANRTEIRLDELSTSDLAKILAKLKDEHGLANEPNCASYMYLRRTDLGVLNHSPCTQGKVADFLASRNLGDAHSVVAFYRTLFEEVKRRTNHETEPGSFEDIIHRKSITKAGFQAMIDTLQNPRDFDAVTGQITEQLQKCGVAFSTTRAIIGDCKRVFLERRGNRLPKGLSKTCQQIVAGILDAGGEHSIKELVGMGLERLKDRDSAETRLYKDSYLTAMLLLFIYEY